MSKIPGHFFGLPFILLKKEIMKLSRFERKPARKNSLQAFKDQSVAGKEPVRPGQLYVQLLEREEDFLVGPPFSLGLQPEGMLLDMRKTHTLYVKAEERDLKKNHKAFHTKFGGGGIRFRSKSTARTA